MHSSVAAKISPLSVATPNRKEDFSTSQLDCCLGASGPHLRMQERGEMGSRPNQEGLSGIPHLRPSSLRTSAQSGIHKLPRQWKCNEEPVCSHAKPALLAEPFLTSLLPSCCGLLAGADDGTSDSSPPTVRPEAPRACKERGPCAQCLNL